MGFHDLRTPDRWMSIVSAVLLAGYFLFAMYAMFSPSNDPQQGMAQGFIILVGLVLLSLVGALWFGVARKHPWMVRTVFALSIFPALSQTAQEIFLLVHRAQ
jgi:multisubunit Na+/H+ antiporter MnhB subunit